MVYQHKYENKAESNVLLEHPQHLPSLLDMPSAIQHHLYAFRAFTLLVGWQEGHLACKTE